MPVVMLLSAAALLASAAAPVEPGTLSVASPEPAPQSIPLDRARANYEAILRGEKTLFVLTPTEQDEVRELDRRVRAQQPVRNDDPYERCIDQEYAKLGREPTALDQRTIETRCR